MGNILEPRKVNQIFDRIIRRAGLPKIRFHDLRHTHGTRLKEMKVDGAIIQEALGHEDPRSTARYVHVDDMVMEPIELLGITYFRDKMEEKTA